MFFGGGGHWPGTKNASLVGSAWDEDEGGIPPRTSHRWNEGWQKIVEIMKDKPPFPRWIQGPDHVQQFDRTWTDGDYSLCDDIILNSKLEAKRSKIEHEAWVADVKAKNAKLPWNERIYTYHEQDWLSRKEIWTRPCKSVRTTDRFRTSTL